MRAQEGAETERARERGSLQAGGGEAKTDCVEEGRPFRHSPACWTVARRTG